jgi:hypothetical protein
MLPSGSAVQVRGGLFSCVGYAVDGLHPDMMIMEQEIDTLFYHAIFKVTSVCL